MRRTQCGRHRKLLQVRRGNIGVESTGSRIFTVEPPAARRLQRRCNMGDDMEKIRTVGLLIADDKEYEKVESGKKRPCEVMRDLKLNESTYYRYRKRYLTEHKKGE